MASTDARASPDKISPAEISRAIERFLRVPSTVPGFSEVLSRLQTMPLGSLSDLDGQSFQNLVMISGGARLQEEAEKQQREAQINHDRDMKAMPDKPVDILGRTLHGGMSKLMGRIAGGSDDGKDSSARYDGIPAGKGDWGSPAGLDYMRNFAIKNGLPWAANNPELLRLGPEAIKALADVQLKQQNYTTMTKEFGMKPTETVQTAKEAKKRNVDLNGVVETADSIRSQLPVAQRDEFKRSVREFLPHMNDSVAEEKFTGKLNQMQERNRELAPQFQQLRQRLKLKGTEAKIQHGTEKRQDETEQVKAAQERRQRQAELDKGKKLAEQVDHQKNKEAELAALLGDATHVPAQPAEDKPKTQSTAHDPKEPEKKAPAEASDSKSAKAEADIKTLETAQKAPDTSSRSAALQKASQPKLG